MKELSSKATLTVAFMTILVSVMVLTVALSSLYSIGMAAGFGDELSIPPTGMFLIFAITAMALMALAVSAIRIAGVTRMAIKKRKANKKK